ncbi:hypothetical protein CPB83DRAFT_748176, partial [Crepidotus variabilis]
PQLTVSQLSACHLQKALNYLDLIKGEYDAGSTTYAEFLEAMKQFRTQKLSTPAVVQQVVKLFKDKPQLIQMFAMFLPESSGYAILVSSPSA